MLDGRANELLIVRQPRDSADSAAGDRDRGQHWAKLRTAVVCIVALTCLASIVANVCFYVQKSTSQEGSPLSCFLCDEIEGYPVDWSKVQRLPEHSNWCCTQPKDFLTLVKMTTVETAKQWLAGALSSIPNGTNVAVSQIRPSVHLGLPSLVRRGGDVVRGCNVMTEITTWMAGPNGHVRGDASVKSGRIFVKTTGLYQVYSQVSTDEPSSGSTSTPMLRQSIFRDNPSLHVVAEELLTTGITQCKDMSVHQSRDSDSSSPTFSYLGGAVQLFRGDEVYVKASCINRLINAASATYFGMYMV